VAFLPATSDECGFAPAQRATGPICLVSEELRLERRSKCPEGEVNMLSKTTSPKFTLPKFTLAKFTMAALATVMVATAIASSTSSALAQRTPSQQGDQSGTFHGYPLSDWYRPDGY
jgi:hypothetical protein